MIIKTDDVKYLLSEANYRATGSRGPISPQRYYGNVLVNESAFKKYVGTLSSYMDPRTASDFSTLANSTRKHLLESALARGGNITYYETLSIPLLSVFYPRLVTREALTVEPINKPEVIKSFIKPMFRKIGEQNFVSGVRYDDVSMTVVQSTVTSTSVINGIQATNNIAYKVPICSITGNAADCNPNSGKHMLQPATFELYGVADASGSTPVVYTVVNSSALNDNFGSARLTVDNTIDGTVYDNNGQIVGRVIGKVDIDVNSKRHLLTLTYIPETGSSVTTITHFLVRFAYAVETLDALPEVEFIIDKITLKVSDRQITTSWSIQFEQDVKAMYDLDIQSNMIATMGQQIALDIDNETMRNIQQAVSAALLKNQGHRSVFPAIPPSNFTFGQKEWYKNIKLAIDKVANTIYTSTNISAANMLLINPQDSYIFEALDDFTYTYDGLTFENGQIGWKEGAIAGSKYKVIVSPVVPKGKIFVLFYPQNQMQISMIYAPYIPAVVHAYPNMNLPRLTLMSRYARATIRPEAFGVVEIDYVNQAPTNWTP